MRAVITIVSHIKTLSKPETETTRTLPCWRQVGISKYRFHIINAVTPWKDANRKSRPIHFPMFQQIWADIVLIHSPTSRTKFTLGNDSDR